MNQAYEIVGSTTRQTLNDMGQLVAVIVVRFTFGDGFDGEIEVPQKTATAELIHKKITEHIALFT